ncbi:hypothetical protein BJF85_12605 [Saccharomonospora sp. CUA-673]|nr:hypothetical protein BJF85_12605 [Saccharomonospora sp. CUA-673]
MRMLGRARLPQSPQVGRGGTARMVSVSTVTSMPSAGQMPEPQPARHCRWWMEPWTSATSVNPARWNCPSTLDVNTCTPPGLAVPQRRRVSKPSWGVVRR